MAASPELARKLAVQLRVAATIRRATAHIAAPERLRRAYAERRDAGGNPCDRPGP